MDIERTRNALSALAVFSDLKNDPLISAMADFIDIPDDITQLKLDAITQFANALYKGGTTDLKEYILRKASEDENPYLIAKAKGAPISKALEITAMHELDLLDLIGSFTMADAAEVLDNDSTDMLPGWTVSDTNIKQSYLKMIDDIPTSGYGIFAKYYAFKIENGNLTPVKHPDPKTLDKLYGYDDERKIVFENTSVLAEGGHAENVLLYGDAGTGKSSTIKACASHFANKGVRLVEFSKNQISDIPKIIDEVYDSPLKYIFYIDDLSFDSDGDDFCYLKGILEGNITERSENIVIYATSNRRHLVRESNEDRLGSDIHVNDTLQQTMSLSARFGIMVTFVKPGKDLYLEIVTNLANDEGIDMPKEELRKAAERFAIEQNGRSPRTAQHFIRRLLSEREN